MIFGFAFLALATTAYPQSPREQLQQMVEQLQKTPNDNALRERIIKLGAEIEPAQAIREEANRAYVKGGVFQKEAKDVSGYDLAISAYREALRVAPWWADAYYDLGVALTSAHKFDEAITSLKLYIASVPTGSAEAREAQNRIYAIEAKAEMASKAEAEKAAQLARAKAKADETLIVPGERIGRVRIGMNEGQVVAALGSPTRREVFMDSEVFMSWGAEPTNIHFSLRDGVVPEVYTLRRAYATADGLSVGSSLSDVTGAMGNPGRTWESEKNRGAAVCYSQGIRFVFDDGGAGVGASIFSQRSKVTAINVVKTKGALNHCN
jgi:tetratricopeptide (TPR) repeat protein